jgi:RNA polymerase sigma-70 factor (sigma-E family)
MSDPPDNPESPTGFDDRFDHLAAIAHRVAFRLLGDRGEAEDVAQEALARAFARWSSVAEHAEPWIARVATNLAIGRWRWQRRRTAVPFDEALRAPHHAAAGRDRGLDLVLERQGLVAGLRRLPRRQREVLVLRYLADLPEREVAAALGTSTGSVKQHAHRALARLRADLVPRPPEVDGVPAPR